MTRTIDLDWLRREFIKALAANDDLYDALILKGGNALHLVHGIGNRASLDLDYSMPRDFDDLPAEETKLTDTLASSLAQHALILFDARLVPKPRNSGDPTWGGYQFEFKVVEQGLFDELDGNLDKIRKQAIPIGPGMPGPVFKIQISKFEYCEGCDEVLVDDYGVRVYTPAMIVAEKLRAICQQMPDYRKRTRQTARARDFYDIHTVVTTKLLDLSTHLDLVRAIFDAKEVPLKLLPQIREHREFHRTDWPKVCDSVPSLTEGFDFYVDFVLSEVRRLEALWVG